MADTSKHRQTSSVHRPSPNHHIIYSGAQTQFDCSLIIYWKVSQISKGLGIVGTIHETWGGGMQFYPSPYWFCQFISLTIPFLCRRTTMYSGDRTRLDCSLIIYWKVRQISKGLGIVGTIDETWSGGMQLNRGVGFLSLFPSNLTWMSLSPFSMSFDRCHPNLDQRGLRSLLLLQRSLHPTKSNEHSMG